MSTVRARSRQPFEALRRRKRNRRVYNAGTYEPGKPVNTSLWMRPKGRDRIEIGKEIKTGHWKQLDGARARLRSTP